MTIRMLPGSAYNDGTDVHTRDTGPFEVDDDTGKALCIHSAEPVEARPASAQGRRADRPARNKED